MFCYVRRRLSEDEKTKLEQRFVFEGMLRVIGYGCVS